MGTWATADAAGYTAGVDRSPTEVADLFRADHPDSDPVEFLVEALGLDPSAAAEAIAMSVALSAPVPSAPAPAAGPATVVELTAEGLAGLGREQLASIAQEAGIAVGKKSAEKLAAEILEVVAFADAVENAAGS